MKRCFSTLCCLDAGPEQVIKYALSANMEGVEARVNENGETFGKCTVADSGMLRSMFADAGIAITDMALSCSIKTYDPKQIEIARAGIDFASAVGSGAIRVFVGEHQSRFSDSISNDMGGIEKSLMHLSDYGKENDVEIWLETHSSFSSGKAMKELTDSLQRDNIKVIWDVMHSLEYNESPEETVGYLGGRIAHIHLKDGHPGNDPDLTQYVHTDLGKGSMPVDKVISALENIEYNGYFSLEWESPWRPEIRELYPDINDLLSSYNSFLDNAVL